MSEMSSGSAANSTSRPDAAAGDMPAESDLPAMQGLDSGVTSGTDQDADAAGADLADDTGSISETSTEGTRTSSSDRCLTLLAPAAAERSPGVPPHALNDSRRHPIQTSSST